MANEAAQVCLAGDAASDDACMASASEALEDCATGCATGAPVAEGSAEATPELLYYAYLCSGELVIFGTANSVDEVRSVCQLNEFYNPHFGGLRCMLGEEELYNTCAAGEEGSGAASPTEPVATPPVAGCYEECRSFANAVINACLGYGYGDDLCLASGQAQFDSCLSGCPEASDAPVASPP